MRQLFALIGVSLQNYPQIDAGGAGSIQAEPAAQAGTANNLFTATATNMDLEESPTQSDPITPNSSGSAASSIAIYVDNSGDLVSGAGSGTPTQDLVVQGAVTLSNGTTYNGVLLTGTIQQFGYQFDNSPAPGVISSQAFFDFLFQPTSGLLESYFTGDQIGVTISGTSSNPTFPAQPFESGFTCTAPKCYIGPVSPPGPQISTPSISTKPSSQTVTLGASTTTLTDTATLSGGSTSPGPTGTITFDLYYEGSGTPVLVDNETVTVNGDGNYTTPTGYTVPTSGAVAGLYQWDATYSGDGNNASVSETNNASEQVNVSPAPPTITTTPCVTTTTGKCGCYGSIGYWHCQTGQSCISSCSTKIGAWCASNCSNLFGCSNPYTSGGLSNCGGATSWGGLSNSQCGTLFNTCCTATDLHSDTYAQACGVAFGLCLSGGNGGSYNIGSNGAAFGCANNTVLTCSQILQCVNNCFSPSTGKFCGGNNTLCQQLNNVLCGINCSGCYPTSGPVCGGSELLNDTATLAGGYYETGTITFYLFAPGITPNSTDSNNVYADTVTVKGNGTYSTATQGNNPGGYTPNMTGTYQWVAVYSGDSNNKGAISAYGSEPVQVGQTCPAIFSTTPNCTSVTLGSGSVTLTDSADLEEGMNPTGTITWTLYLNQNNTSTLVDTETATVKGNGIYTTPKGYTLPTTGNVTGTYQWDATYTGDNYNASYCDNNNPHEQTVVSPATPSITTTPSVTTTTGTCGCYGSIGYWHGQGGQSCISSCSSNIGSWCASNCSNLFGCSNPYTCGGLSNCGGATSWGGLSNSQCGTLFNTCCTATDLHSDTYAQACGLAFGLCASGGNGGSYNIGSNGAAFGCANNTVLTCSQILQCVNNCFNPSTGKFCGGNNTLCQQLNNVLCGINCSGCYPTSGPVCGGSELLNDTATLSGGYNETGTITFYLMGPGSTSTTPYTSAVYTDVVTVSGNGTYSTATAGSNKGGYTPTTTGTYQWVAVYSGDSNNKSVLSAFGCEPVQVCQASPAIFSTTPSCTSVTLGTSKVILTDSADLEEGANPTGTITWTLIAPNGTPVFTSSDNVTANGTYTSGGYTLPTSGNVTGKYQWNATYVGDTNNASYTDSNNPNECTVVSPACTTITTTPTPSSVTLGSSSVLLKDTATLAGGYSPTGSITFTLYSPGGTLLDTETVNVSANGSYTTPTGYTLAANAAGGTYQWDATYTGDSNNVKATDSNDCNEQVSVKAACTGSICGYVFCDDNLDGLFDCSYQDCNSIAETGEAGATIQLKQGSTVIATTTSGTGGYYSFSGLALGTYTVSITCYSANHQAEQSHGSVCISNSTCVTLTSSCQSVCGPAEGKQGNGMNNGLDFAEIAPGGLEGFVWDDANNDGNIDYNEAGIVNVTITLNGTTYTGQSVTQTSVTNNDGEYEFTGLLPGSYTLTESTPSGFKDGKDSVGTLGGSECYSSNCSSTSGCNTDCYSDQGYNCFTNYSSNCFNYGCGSGSYCNNCSGNSNFCGGQYNCGWNSGCNSSQNVFCGIQIGGCEDVGCGYNFGETGGTLSGCSTNTGSLAFWNNSYGQALICSLNGCSSSTALGNWLAATYPNIYGVNATNAKDFAGWTNLQIAAFYHSNDFCASGVKLNAAVLSAALSCYVTNSTWAGGNYAAKYGFTVTAQGVGYDTVNVGSNGCAFGVANNSTITILQALDATNQQAVDGLLYDGNSSLICEAYSVYAAIAQNGQNT